MTNYRDLFGTAKAALEQCESQFQAMERRLFEAEAEAEAERQKLEMLLAGMDGEDTETTEVKRLLNDLHALEMRLADVEPIILELVNAANGSRGASSVAAYHLGEVLKKLKPYLKTHRPELYDRLKYKPRS